MRSGDEQETIALENASFVVDRDNRVLLGWGRLPSATELPGGVPIPAGTLFWQTSDQKQYAWSGTAWTEVSAAPTFNAEYWEDLRFPASGFNPAGSTAPPTVDTSTGLLVFSGSADNIIGGIAQMPHGWAKGTAVRPHLHLIAPTSNAGKNTRWKFEYNRANNREAFDNNYGSYTTLDTITVANPASANTLLLPDGFGDIPMTGFRESCCILWRITRLANSDAADNDTSDWVLAEFDIHYQVEKTGTITEIPA